MPKLQDSPDDNTVSYGLWPYLPDPVLLEIFEHLSFRDLGRVAQTCQAWRNAAGDEAVWRKRLQRDFHVSKRVSLPPGARSWKKEYKRLFYNVPIVETEMLSEHCHQVLHVSFSHDGKLFATCSKDGSVLVWGASYPSRIRYHKDMRQYGWKYTQFSQFNENDTLLLVSGVQSSENTTGEIAIFSLEGSLQLQCRVENRPYDVFGTWYSEEFFISGDLKALAQLVTASILWLTKASQEIDSEHKAVMNRLFHFRNKNGSTIRTVMIAKCLGSEKDIQKSYGDGTSGNSQKHLPSTQKKSSEVLFLLENSSQATALRGKAPEASAQSQEEDVGVADAASINYTQEYRNAQILSILRSQGVHWINTSEPDPNFKALDPREKYLIYTTGSKTYTPHQIGLKRIKPFAFVDRFDVGETLRERVAEKKERERLQAAAEAEADPPLPSWLDSCPYLFHEPDHMIDFHGHIIGMALSPDHRYLYVNVRPWPEGYTITNPPDPPPIAQEIDLHVIDLVTLTEVGKMLRSHRAYTPNEECFFIFLDVTHQYVASGAEDKHGYLWDRHYGISLGKYPHRDVVNCVAFSPQDTELLVTASDDYTLKVWRSRHSVKKLGLETTNLTRGVELRKE